MGTPAARLKAGRRPRPIGAATALLSLLCFGSGLGCERSLPGPEECQRAALRALGVRDPALLEVPKVRSAVTEETVRCLTTPYDALLVRCIEERGASPRCVAEFEARRRAGSS